MAGPEKRRGLGRGLSALMADVTEDTPQTRSVASDMVPIEKVFPNPDQPRNQFTAQELDELTESIRTRGILQPLIVREKNDGYEIVAGERRWRAAQGANLHEVPVRVRSYSDTEVLEVAIIENVQRADLNPIEEAAGYQMLIDRFGHTQEKVATALGKSRSHIANLLRLLSLPEDVRALVMEGKLSAGHARALITSDNASALARQVVSQGLSVRETEALMKSGARPKTAKPNTTPGKDADTRALEQDLGAALAMKVSIKHAPEGEAGQITLHYKSLEQLDDLMRRLAGD